MNNIVKLSAPLMVHGNEVTSLTFREVTTQDVMEENYPYLIIQSESDSNGIELRAKVIAKYIVRLAQVPLSSVKAMPLKDFSTCQEMVMNFFGQGSAAAQATAADES